MTTINKSGPRPGRGLTHLLVGGITLLIVIPVAWVLVASLKRKSEFFGSPWTLPEGLHLQNYVDAFGGAQMGRYFATSVLVTLLGLVFVLAVSVPAAYVVARYEFRGKGIVEVALLAGLFVNVNYIVVPIFLMLVDWDRALVDVFPDGFFLDNPAMLSLVYAATSIPFTIYLLTAYFRSIPAEFEEAALLDGASRFRIMTRVMLPMARPAVTTVILFNFLAYWNDFVIALTLLPGEGKTLQVGLLNLMAAQKAAADPGRLYAGMVIVIVPVLLLYALIQRRLIQGMAAGGVKG
ncbi:MULTISPECIES: carbohydrate ABC transporter permease [Micromonospora]|jgi:N-acetylglucosamine transport system permease protein|uniref:Carbohydrate ABC transporter permease n=1 Tax=Micromonospora zamorensis TaxID=709883 RepID=A0ABZ1PJG5_9ACTN|nr:MULTISPECIES: carbohydrate ABC transporter permease [Micromonospora]MBQ0977231.1 carbohydrate ABC transporter permease [Micromonospora sp. M61]MBQ1034916.1 carbohydrate ABC transporter permease [Micromonospora sp. C81]WSK49160.1 carbohydrate ABC transporter permease [Micromonospora zamorensis]WTE88142.1 carbohydrate ABC transporter permease [Micromonospora zamorensis]SCG53686.1 N-acetylglucosamine transport system permease protein [Micromonospora zamorensis]